MNKLIFSGNISRDPEFGVSKSGNPYVRFSVANNDRGKDAGADFLHFTGFGKTAELCEKYMFKGQSVFVDGSVQNSNYTDKNGQKVYRDAYIANRVEFLTWREKGERTDTPPSGYAELDDDDCPY